jgi:hypothetical protein
MTNKTKYQIIFRIVSESRGNYLIFSADCKNTYTLFLIMMFNCCPPYLSCRHRCRLYDPFLRKNLSENTSK